MQYARKYQRFAARCLQEASATTDPRLKMLLVEMAQEWQRFAEDAKAEKSEQQFRSPKTDPGD
jgi:hypothetical protein